MMFKDQFIGFRRATIAIEEPQKILQAERWWRSFESTSDQKFSFRNPAIMKNFPQCECYTNQFEFYPKIWVRLWILLSFLITTYLSAQNSVDQDRWGA